MNYFDIYDKDRPIIWDEKTVGFERVCRICGETLKKKNGEYSYHKRYCNKCIGDSLYDKYNWSMTSKKYAIKIAEENKEYIIEKIKELNFKEDILYNITICEECKSLCQIYDGYALSNKKINVVNIHHKIPVHTLTGENLNLIWDYDNLIALCENCHSQQDHKLRTVKVEFHKFRKITQFL